MSKIELLSPARDLETGLAAINCGADAVYLGAPQFGAREAAGNDLKSIEELTRYAHKYWARVYVTVNTLLQDVEIPAAEALIQQLYDIGVDAIIIQDAGLLEADLPPIPLFASTQMHNTTPERVAFLEKVGIQRVILARELSLEQIRDIRAQTHVELETFIHGALCVSYSGQCYMSYALGGRSGNRGQCAQTCRRLYSLVDRTGKVLIKERYLLSLRDLNLSDHLSDLLAAGVTSFKIEGRLKDRAYVMNVVAHYRRLLDTLLESGAHTRASSGRSIIDFTPDPNKTFNRGFTPYFINGRGAPITSPDTPKSIGEPLGKVAYVQRNAVRINSPIELHAGDGICYFNSRRELQGATVFRIEPPNVILDWKASAGDMLDVAVGTFLYRNHDQQFISEMQKSRPERKIGLSFHLQETPDGLMLTARDADANHAQISLPCEKARAEKPEQARASIEKQLRKLGDTEFECTHLKIGLAEPYFIPLSVLNELRRETIKALVAVREQNRPRSEGGAVINRAPYPQTELSFTGNVLNRHAEGFYRRHGVTTIEPAAEAGTDLRGRRLMTTKLCLRYELGACLKVPNSAHLEDPLHLVDESGRQFSLRFNCSACEMEVYWGTSSVIKRDLI